METIGLHQRGNEAYQVAASRREGGCSAEKYTLKGEFDAELGGEGDADGGAGAEEIAEGAGGNEQLLATSDRHGAHWIRAKRGNVREIVHGNGQSTDITDVVVARIAAIEEVEEFDEGRERPALVELDGAADAQ